MIEASNFLEFAKSSIEENGASVILRQTGSETYNTTTGNLTSSTTDCPTKGIIENYSEYYIKSGLVKAGDRRVMVAASLPVVPQQGDTLLIGAEVFNIINVKSDFAGDILINATLYRRCLKQALNSRILAYLSFLIISKVINLQMGL